MDEMTLEQYIEHLRTLRVHAQGVAARQPSGELRSLTKDEKDSLGITPVTDLSFLRGKEFDFGDTRFKLRFD